MGVVLFPIFYASILFFIIATVLRVKKCVRAPVHLHWDLYAGSSIYERMNWWTEVQGTFGRKLRSMILDLLFLREFYHRNRRFWAVLYAFHIGLYSLILWHLWLFVFAALAQVETASGSGWVWGTLSTALAFAGGMGILIMRTLDPELRSYYPPIHFLKWAFILVTLLGGVYAVDVHFRSSMPALLKYVKEQVAFSDLAHKLHPSFGPGLHVAFASAWLIYLPYSHVFQLFFRYYHFLRWDEVPMVRGSEIEHRVNELIEEPIGWAAPHIPSGKRWSDVVVVGDPSGAGSDP